MIPSEEQTLAKLDKEPKYKIRIKPEKENPNYVTERVFVNGVCYQIPVGEEVEVAKTVYDILINRGII